MSSERTTTSEAAKPRNTVAQKASTGMPKMWKRTGYIQGEKTKTKDKRQKTKGKRRGGDLLSFVFCLLSFAFSFLIPLQ
jgi:hypothetical protein